MKGPKQPTLLIKTPQKLLLFLSARRLMSRVVVLVPAPRLVQAGLLKSLAWTAPVKVSWVSTLIVITPALHVADTLGANTASTPAPGPSLLVSVSGPGVVANTSSESSPATSEARACNVDNISDKMLLGRYGNWRKSRFEYF